MVTAAHKLIDRCLKSSLFASTQQRGVECVGLRDATFRTATDVQLDRTNAVLWLPLLLDSFFLFFSFSTWYEFRFLNWDSY